MSNFCSRSNYYRSLSSSDDESMSLLELNAEQPIAKINRDEEMPDIHAAYEIGYLDIDMMDTDCEMQDAMKPHCNPVLEYSGWSSTGTIDATYTNVQPMTQSRIDMSITNVVEVKSWSKPCTSSVDKSIALNVADTKNEMALFVGDCMLNSSFPLKTANAKGRSWAATVASSLPTKRFECKSNQSFPFFTSPPSYAEVVSAKETAGRPAIDRRYSLQESDDVCCARSQSLAQDQGKLEAKKASGKVSESCWSHLGTSNVVRLSRNGGWAAESYSVPPYNMTALSNKEATHPEAHIPRHCCTDFTSKCEFEKKEQIGLEKLVEDIELLKKSLIPKNEAIKVEPIAVNKPLKKLQKTTGKTTKTLGTIERSIPAFSAGPSGKNESSKEHATTRLATLNVCILFDNTTSAMAKLLPPLLATLDTFWDLVSSTEQELSICLVTPAKRHPFTSKKNEFLEFFKDLKIELRSQKVGDCGVESLLQGLKRLKKLKWNSNSNRFLYIFGNLSWVEDEDKKIVSSELMSNLRNSLRWQFDPPKILVATWLHHNDLLIQALGSQEHDFHTFQFLNAKKMASFIVQDEELIKGIMLSLRHDLDSVERKVCFSQQQQLRNNLLDSKRANTTEPECFNATVWKAGILVSIQSILSEKGRFLFGRKRTVVRDGRKSHSSGRTFSCVGKVLPNRDIWMKVLLADYLKLRPDPQSRKRYEAMAFVSRIAQFLANEYNKCHRPDHCAKLRFVNGWVVEEEKASEPRLFFAEDFVQSDEFQRYCDCSGQWNESLVVDESLLRFVQTTFKLSGGDLMVVGLHGSFKKEENVFILTTPTVLSKRGGCTTVNQCNGAYMKKCRTQTKALLENLSFSQMPSESKAEPRKEVFCFRSLIPFL
ncbi:alpha-kinase family protein [Nitzschia inconspicua]|uniref:Alpha-kinase family protein n=1 Tax=Nitzschia inconspicua TaxID=303405 RepID=A0A9K3KME3_9STRA|nr:alpha-kinase family protein [Nitzschia inconspicua]